MRKQKDVMQNEFIKSALSDEDNLIYERAMDVNSKSIAIGFAEWIGENYYKVGEKMYAPYVYPTDITWMMSRFTTDQLYDKFISQS